jgi:hypothetical protein
VINPGDVVFRKKAVENAIEVARRLSIAAERLLDNHAWVCSGAPFCDPLCHGRKQAWRNGEIMQRLPRILQFLAQPHIGLRMARDDLCKPLDYCAGHQERTALLCAAERRGANGFVGSGQSTSLSFPSPNAARSTPANRPSIISISNSTHSMPRGKPARPTSRARRMRAGAWFRTAAMMAASRVPPSTALPCKISWPMSGPARSTPW